MRDFLVRLCAGLVPKTATRPVVVTRRKGHEPMSRTVLILALFLAAMGLACHGAVSAQGLDWSVLRPSGLEAPPGEFVTYVVDVVNGGDAPAQFRWTIDVPPSWAPLASSGEVDVEPGGSTPVFVTMYVPASAPAGEHGFRMTVAKMGTGETVQWDVGAVVPVRRGLRLEQPSVPAGYPGDQLEYVVVVQNIGNVSEDVELFVMAPDGWGVDRLGGGFSLEPGSSAAVRVPVVADRRAPAGVVRRVQVTARTTDGEVAETLSLTATIQPPHPGLVPALRPDALPARLRFTTGPMREGRPWNPRLDITARGRVGENEDTELAFNLRVERDELERVFVSRWNSYFRRDPWSFRLGLSRSRSTQAFQERFTLTYDERPWWVSLGDVSLRLTPLLRPSGRGGAVRFFHEGGVDAGVFALGSSAGATLGQEWERAELRLTFVGGDAPYRPAWSLYGLARVSDETTLEGETASIEGEAAWFLGARWQRSPWSLRGRYFWYGSPAVGGANGQSGFEFGAAGRVGNAPFELAVSDTRTNVLRNPDERVDAIARASLSSSFPVGTASFRGVLRYHQVQSLTVPPGITGRDQSALSSDFTLQRRLDAWYWLVRARASSRQNRITDTHDATFHLGPAVGRSWPTVRAEVGVALHGAGETLEEAWNHASLGPTLSIHWRPRVLWNPYLRLEYLAGQRPRLAARASLELSDSLDFFVSAQARYHTARPDWTFSAGLTHRFGLPVPGVYSRGTVEGQVYIVNGNGPAPNGNLAGIVVTVNGQRVSTDAEGYFRFAPLRAGEYEVGLDNLSVLGVAYQPQVALPLLVEVEAGETATVAIPIKLVSQATGRVYFESVQNIDIIGSSLAGVVIEFRQAGALAARVVTDALGFYETPMMEPGEYEVHIVPGTLPRWTAPAEAFPARVVLEAGRILRYDVGLKETEIPIRLDVDL